MNTKDVLYDVDVLEKKLESIVEVKGPDQGIVYLDVLGSSHYDKELECYVYDHVYFSELGDALIELYSLVTELKMKLLRS